MCEPRRSVTAVSRRDALAGGGIAMLAAAAIGRRSRPAQTVPGDDGVEVAPGLVIRRRSAWAAGLAPKPGLVPEDVKFLLVHHTAGRNDDTIEEVPKTLRLVYKFHTGPDKGWPDVCYNFFVDPYGTVWEGRAGSLDGPVAADATGGSQGFAQLVCLLGDFTKVMPTDLAIDSLTRTLAWLADRYDVAAGADSTVKFVSRGSNRWPAGTAVTAKTVSGHRDMSSTACPGDTFYPFVHGTLPELVRARTTGGSGGPAATPSVATTTTTATSPTSAASPKSIPASSTPLPSTSSSVEVVTALATTVPATTLSTSASVQNAMPAAGVPLATLISVEQRGGVGRGSGTPNLAIGAGAAVVVAGVAAAVIARQRRDVADEE